MRRRSTAGLVALSLALAACGGGGSAPGSGTGTAPPTVTPTPTPTPTPSVCSLRSRQDWAAGQLREWYLFPETLPASLDPSGFATVEAYVDALTATARGQGRDRFFTFLTSIAEENAFFSSGATAAFGIRIQTDTVARRLFVIDAYEGAPALAAGIDRGTEIIGIGTTLENLRSVDSIIASEGSAGISSALGPSTAGTSRVLRIVEPAGTRSLTVTKAEFSIPPISPRFGTQILTDNGQRIGYLNLRTFITPADPALRSAFATFKAQGVSQIIIDFRYNGGGLVDIADLMGDLLGDNRLASDVYSFTTFRPEKSQFNETRQFRRLAQSIAPVRIAFIGTSGTASASEIVINAFTPYLRTGSALIGTNTFGKPVGQIARDRAECDDRLRIVAFAEQNAERRGNYFNGLASEVAASCAAGDSFAQAMGDPAEASTKVALDFLAGRSCTAISTDPRPAALREGQRKLVMPARPNAAQREVPGTF
ncbi:MAG: S41 family peptidase [Polymorphobacter sp.]